MKWKPLLLLLLLLFRLKREGEEERRRGGLVVGEIDPPCNFGIVGSESGFVWFYFEEESQQLALY